MTHPRWTAFSDKSPRPPPPPVGCSRTTARRSSVATWRVCHLLRRLPPQQDASSLSPPPPSPTITSPFPFSRDLQFHSQTGLGSRPLFLFGLEPETNDNNMHHAVQSGHQWRSRAVAAHLLFKWRGCHLRTLAVKETDSIIWRQLWCATVPSYHDSRGNAHFHINCEDVP